jgi:outer membrane lipoprotein
MPEAGDASDGRFMVEVGRYLDPVVFARGRAVTVAGPVVGVRTEPVGEAPYSYVVIQGQEVHLWARDRYAPYPPYYGPWDDPFWDPWWPWWGGPRFFDDRRHR